MPLSEKEETVVLGYRDLLNQVEEIRKQDVGLDAVAKIRSAMDVAENLIVNVCKPREIGLDARVLELSSVVVQQNAENIDSVFRPLEFADKLVNILTSKANSEASVWTAFSEMYGYLLPVRPTFDYMLGTYSRDGFKPKVRAPRQCHQRKYANKELIKATVEKPSIKDDLTMGQQEILDLIAKKIRKLYRTDEKPINYFEFILNPDSFEETCQNVLNVAFLVRDSLVKMYTENGELLMVPCKPKKDDMGGIQKEEAKRQFVIQMDKKDWKELVELYNITKPVIDFGLSSQSKSSLVRKR